MSEENENVMPDLLDLQEFDEEALKKESEEVLQMKFLTAENAVFSRTEGGFLALLRATRSLKDMKKDVQEMVQEQIRLRYFLPVIRKVMDVKDEYGYAYWHVMTDFGVCRFTTHMGGDAVINIGGSRYQITDIDGNRYELPDLYALTVMERKKLDLFI